MTSLTQGSQIAAERLRSSFGNKEEATPEPTDLEPRVIVPSDLVKIQRSDGRYEWVTPQELELLNQKKLDEHRIQRLRRQRDVASTMALAGLVVGLAGLLQLLRDQPSENVRVEAPETTAVALPEPVTATPAASPPVAEPRRRAVGQKEAEELVEAWATAWSRQDAAEYTSFYSLRFTPPDDMSRSDWEAMRRQRIEAPESIVVTLKDLEVSLAGDDAAVARFVQIYRSPTYQDETEKTLMLIKEWNQWWIRQESTGH